MLRKFRVYTRTSIQQVDTFRRDTVILLPKISNPLAHFTFTPSYTPPFIKYIFMLPSSTSSHTHNYFFLFELVFNLVCFLLHFCLRSIQHFPFRSVLPLHIYLQTFLLDLTYPYFIVCT